MRKESGKRSSDSGDPRELRDRAASIRWAAESMQSETRVRELQEFADELEAEANRLEAANHRRSRRTG
jgi:hypothetical protein